MEYSREKFVGHNNDNIKKIFLKINDLELKILKLKNKIEKIQKNCDHKYKLALTGPYDDLYICQECGHEDWH